VVSDFGKQSDRDEQFLMRKVCGEAFANVLRDNERLDYLEQFMIRKPRRPQTTSSHKQIHQKPRRGIYYKKKGSLEDAAAK
jgi:hypothetical protein